MSKSNKGRLHNSNLGKVKKLEGIKGLAIMSLFDSFKSVCARVFRLVTLLCRSG